MSQHTERATRETNAQTRVRAATYARHHHEQPQITHENGARTWITRAANFVVALTEAAPGTTLAREDNPDEYMLLLTPGASATIQAGSEMIDSKGDSLTIVPPGRSVVTATSKGTVTRIFSHRAADLCARASNAKIYADGAPEVAPLVPWPAPPAGFKLRHYALEKYIDANIFGRLFRSTNLMVNVFEPTTQPRDPRKLSPHSHADFEQGSLSLSGTVVHHMRTPWTPDMTAWREDEHVEFHSPALLVIPANMIHTTQYIGGGPNWFVDVFAPPRIDFSEKAGWVRNADEYPMPNR